MVAAGGNIELLHILRNQELINSPETGETVLHIACFFGRFEMSKMLLDIFPELLATKDFNGTGVLHFAALGGNIEMLEFLLEKGLNIYERANNGKTVLHFCCSNGKTDMSKYLVNKYPYLLRIEDNDGQNALHRAACSGNVALVMFLLEKDLDIKRTTNNRKTVLHLCCLKGKIDMCKYLVNAYPFLLDITDYNGGNALHHAACSGNVALVKFLLEKDLDIKSTKYNGQTVLHLSCLNNKMDMCKYLVNTYPFLLDVTDYYGQNALHVAAWNGNIEILKFLLDKDLDINSTRNDKRLYYICVV
ncbi:putative ankyrin repeat protein RF_0381 [Saccostrea cucullata]|uniref:putative ankyrin repeat protein RF_0381 n=1 Tax=Saccostrea cuccullata TaxID=36930 RepID=UPI002ED0E0AC